MTGRTLIVVSALAGGFLAGCQGRPENRSETDSLRMQVRQAMERAGRLTQENQILKDLLDIEKIDRKKADEMLAANERYVKSLQDLFAGQEGVEPMLGGIRISDAVLFDSGSAQLKENGKTVLALVAKKIAAENLQIRIDGHTDGQPVVRAKEKYPTNWDLSAARALAVLKHLATKGVPEENMSLAAFSQYRPVPGEEGSGNQPNKKNRRVEIAVVSKALEGGDKQ